jgi:hypothetical protein
VDCERDGESQHVTTRRRPFDMSVPHVTRLHSSGSFLRIAALHSAVTQS